MSSNMYDGFDQDNMENEDDMAALGSILSWDDDEERSRNEIINQPSSSSSKQGGSNHNNRSSLSDMPQFSTASNHSENMKDEMGDLSFLQLFGGNMDNNNAQVAAGAATNGNDGQQQQQQQQQHQLQMPSQDFSSSQLDSNQQNQNQDSNFTQQFASLQHLLQQNQQQQPPGQNQQQQIPTQQQYAMLQQQAQQAGGNPQQSAVSNQIAQFVAQQALSMLQQNQHAETQRKEQEKAQQQEQARQQQQAQAMSTMSMLQQNLQRAMQQQQTQFAEGKTQQGQPDATVVQQLQQAAAAQQQQQQPFGGNTNINDPSSFLQQLQLAQLQQQFQAAQQQGNPGQVPGLAQQQQQQLPGAPAMPNSQATAIQQQQLQALATAIRSQQQFQQQIPQAMQDQLKQQYAQVAGNVQIQAPFSSSVAPAFDNKPSASKKSKAGLKKSASSASDKDAPDEQRSSGTSTTSMAATGLVSASDTDYDKKPKSKGSAKRGDDDDDDDEPEEDDEIDMSNLTPEERAHMNRERNKEHARNTRLRKKAYLEKLKATVDDLCKERNTLVSERASAASLLVEMHDTRTEVLMSFFALRSTNEKRRHLWASILDESCFACIMPITPYRSFPASEMQVSKCQRTILGIDGIMGDTSSLHVLFASLVDRIRAPLGKIEFRYTLVAEEAVVAGNQMMARWVMSTTNAMQCGAKMEVYKQGMLCSRFNSSHKIVGLELMFDVMAFMLQLKQAAGVESFTVVPNTAHTCQRTFDKPVVMTAADPPYTIVQVNKLWEEMTGYTADEVVGKASCAILQGARTDRKTTEDMMTEVRFKRATYACVINYKKSGEAFRNHLCLYPLSTDSRIAHYLAITEHSDDGESSNANAMQLQTASPTALPLFSMFQQGGHQPSNGMMAVVHPNQQAPMMGGNMNMALFAGSDAGNKRSHDSGR
ncbi:hypothetical protein MPSEU_000754100 [Mayamaea pseudoterrestris]|nr:hypothetical protein MPSEU_000754100 [Mayamaea pseudoterrestris]